MGSGPTAEKLKYLDGMSKSEEKMSYKQLTANQIENINSIAAMKKIVADCERRMRGD